MKYLPFLVIVWFAVLMPWGRFTDPDAFYHAHLSQIMAHQGPVNVFPWLDLTTLGAQYADQHFLFHASLVPMILTMERLAPGPFTALWATQGMAVAFATFTAGVLWIMLRRIDASRAWVWLWLTLLVPGFSLRMLLGKASPLTVALFIATVWAMGTEGKWRKVILATCGLLFALTHGGWIILVLAAGLMVTADVLLRRLGHDASWRQAIDQSPWQGLLALCGGIAAGLIAHPNRETLVATLWTQIMTAAVAPPRGLVQGMEWSSPGTAATVGTLAPLLIALLIGVCGLLFAPRVAEARRGLRTLILFLMPVTLTLALTLRSQKFIEYLAPTLALVVATLWTLIDIPAFRVRTHEQLATWPRALARIAPTLAVCGIIVLVAHHTWSTWDALHFRNGRDFNAWRLTINAITTRATPGDRVFHSSWDEFPTLFAANDQLRYVSGLDPAFLYDADPTLTNDIQALTFGDATSSAWNIIIERTGSRFVFITTKRFPTFDAALKSDARFQEIARDSETAAYVILTSP